jgi:hypothetical protein
MVIPFSEVACLTVYDATRGGLLRGRKTMLKLCAAQLKQQASALKADEDLVWIDIGGGTGVYDTDCWLQHWRTCN